MIELRTTSMAPSGEAVGHYEVGGERRAVLVRGGVPGELVRVRLDASSRPARGDIDVVVTPSPARVEAACKFVRECGGCDWMHLSRAAQREQHLALTKKVAGDAPVSFYAADALVLAYRTRTRLHLEGKRGIMRVGFFGARSHELVCIDPCIVVDPRIDAARAELSSLFAGAQGRGEVSVALGRNLVVGETRWSRDLPAAVYARIDNAMKGHWQGMRVWCGESRRPSVFGDPTPWMTAADGLPLELAPGGFSQPHTEVNTALALRIAELSKGARRIVELYAGAGNFTVVIAAGADELRAVESSEESCVAARKNLSARKLGLNARVTCADAATYELPKPTDLLVLDPPRTGAREVCERIAGARSNALERIVYVSCDRPTLARDLDLLAPRYRVTSVDVFEMFPQTSHVETVATLQRRAHDAR